MEVELSTLKPGALCVRPEGSELMMVMSRLNAPVGFSLFSSEVLVAQCGEIGKQNGDLIVIEVMESKCLP